jgi:hypothetical protein
MKLSKVFLRAAELVASGEEPYSCDAILRASNGEAPAALLWWRSRFTPREDSPEHYWLRDQKDMDALGRQRWRVLGLCLASWVAKGEGL